MNKKHVLLLFVSLFLLTALAVQALASDTEVEIELQEVIGFIPVDNPLDGSDQGGGGNTPTQPNDFSATITGRTLTVTSGVHDARAIVRKGDGTPVLNRQFVGGTVEQMPAAGNYSLEIQSGSLTLVGVFEAQ